MIGLDHRMPVLLDRLIVCLPNNVRLLPILRPEVRKEVGRILDNIFRRMGMEIDKHIDIFLNGWIDHIFGISYVILLIMHPCV